MWPVDSVKAWFRADAAKASSATLLSEQARPAEGSILHPHRESVAENLKPDRLARLLRDAVNGDGDAYLILAEEMEEREPHYSSVLATRKIAVVGIRPTVESPSDSAHDKAIADHVEEITRRPEFRDLVLDLMDGIAKGFSNVEIIWDRQLNGWEPKAYKWRDPRHFVWDRDTLSVCNLRVAGNSDGEPLAAFKWIQHRPRLKSGIPLRTGLAMPASLAYMAKRYTIADWLTFLDIFGMPVRVGKFPASMQKRTKELLRAVSSIGTEAACVIPKEMEIEFLAASNSGGGGPLFQTTAEYFDKQTSKIVLGQTMSSDDGASLAQSKTHERVRFDYRDMDANSVAATITRDLIIPFVILNYGEQDKYPVLRLEKREPDDQLKLMQATQILVTLGGKVQMSEARDRLGYAEPDEGAELLAAPVPPAGGGDPEQGPDSGKKPVKNGGGGNSQKDADKADKTDKTELNRQVSRVVERLERLQFALRHDDVIDQAQADALEDWRPLLDENVGRLITLAQESESPEALKAILTELETDEGVELDISSFQRALKTVTFKMRGQGSATDSRAVT